MDEEASFHIHTDTNGRNDHFHPLLKNDHHLKLQRAECKLWSDPVSRLHFIDYIKHGEFAS